MLYGAVPFKASSMNELPAIIMKGQYTLKDEISEEAKSLITAILEVDPEKRISLNEILKHPWL
jgi:serine/threonine protein kinase